MKIKEYILLIQSQRENIDLDLEKINQILDYYDEEDLPCTFFGSLLNGEFKLGMKMNKKTKETNAQNPKPKAVFCTNDNVGSATWASTQASGISVIGACNNGFFGGINICFMF